MYKGKYGATLQYAIWLGAALNLQVLKSGYAKPDNPNLKNADYVIIGTSVYIGRLQITAWLKRNMAWLKGKKLVFFIVAGTPPGEKAKLMSYFTQGIPEELRARSSVHFLPGSLCIKKLSWKDRLLLRIGARFAAMRGEKIGTADYNQVKKENLAPVIQEARSLAAIPILDFKSERL